MPTGSYKSHATGGGRGQNNNNNNRNRQSQAQQQPQQQQQSQAQSYSSSVTAAAAAGASAAAPPSSPAPVPLFNQYPISSSWEFTLKGTGVEDEKVKGTIFCTDAIAQMVVLTNDENDFRLLSLHSIQSARQLQKATVSTQELLQKHASTTGNDAAQSRKLLEEREKRELRRMQESLRHIHPKASPKAQIMYDKLLKACNEVEWKQSGNNGDVLSIVVMGQIQVDPPYESENCRLLRTGTGEGSLDRVQKIVAAAAAATTAASST